MDSIPGYELVETLTETRRTIVYRGVHRRDGRPVILKTPRDTYPSSRDLARLRLAYEIARDFESPGLVRAIDLVEVGNRKVLVTEDGGGEALSRRLARGPLAIETSLDLALQIAKALDVVHEAGVIHKDIKPSNLIYDEARGLVAITDFSIASRVPQVARSAVDIDRLEGSLPYISPEQTGRTSLPIDTRSDLYSLGVTLFEMLTGRRPFASRRPMELVHCHLAKTPPAVRDVAPAVPEILSRIVARLMAKAAEDRYQSAASLAADLEHCQTRWDADRDLEPFELGRRGGSRYLHTPRKLHAREREIEELLQAFERARDGSNEVVMLSGPAGVGKTSLAFELQRRLLARNEEFFFTYAKHDQFGSDNFLTTARSAHRMLMLQVMALPPERLERWRARALEALDGMGQLMIEVLPEWQTLLGPQPAVEPLQGRARVARFALTTDRFAATFATERTFVCMWDDNQWGDADSFHQFEASNQRPGQPRILSIHAYRDDEVDASHPAMVALERVKASRPVHHIEIQPIDHGSTSDLIAEMLQTDTDAITGLSDLVFRRTGGNPFHAGQLIQSLHEDRLLRVDPDTGAWTWSRELSDGEGGEGEVGERSVELMARKIERLEPATRDLLFRSSCLGNHFDLQTLALVSDLGREATARQLLPAVRQGLLLALDESFNLAIGESTPISAVPGTSTPLEFVHDRVHEAAYLRVPPEARARIHLEIARRLRPRLELDDERPGDAGRRDDDRLFQVVRHYHRGRRHLEDPDERVDVATLHLQAGLEAMENNALGSAHELLHRAHELMPGDAWETCYPSMIQLHRSLIEVESMVGNHDLAQDFFCRAVLEARSRLEKASLYELMVLGLSMNSAFDEAFDYVRQALRLFGTELPDGDGATRRAIDEELQAVERRIDGRSLDALEALPASDDAEHRIILRLLFQLIASTSLNHGHDIARLASLLMVRHTLDRGATELTPVGWLRYGIVQVERGRIDLGLRYGTLAIRISERLEDRRFQPILSGMFGSGILCFEAPLARCAAHQERSSDESLRAGRLWEAAWTGSLAVAAHSLRGLPLDDLLRETARWIERLESSRNEVVLPLLRLDLEKTRRLLTSPPIDGPEVASGDSARTGSSAHAGGVAHDRPLDLYQEILSSPSTEPWPSLTLFWCGLSQSILSYFCDDVERALEASRMARRCVRQLQFTFISVEHELFHGLCLGSTLSAASESDATPASDTAELVEVRDRLALWAEAAPFNFAHMHRLVEAELARVEQRPSDALRLYQEAAGQALDVGAIHHAAIANERAGTLLLARGLPPAARGYLAEAIYLFKRWGARRKVAQMRARFARDVSAVEDGPELGLDSTTTSTTDFLDLQAVLRANRTLSSQIRVEDLLRQMLALLIESAGAERGALFLEQDGEWALAAHGSIDGAIQISSEVSSAGAASTEPPVSKAVVSQAVVSQAVVQYVLRTGQDVVLDDAIHDQLFSSDPYVMRHRIRSLLCLRIHAQERTVAVLYLENNLTPGAFTSQRLSLLETLTVQAAISIENALLYRELERHNQRLEENVAERTRELEQTNAQLRAKTDEILRTQTQLITQEKLASLGSLAAGVAHEIKNPLNFVRNFASLSSSLAQQIADDERARGAGDQGGAASDERAGPAHELCENLRRIEEHSRRIDSVVSSMLSLSREAAAAPEPTDFNEVVEESVSLAFHGLRGSDQRVADVRVETRLDPSIGIVPVVASSIGRVVLNLCTNALQAVVDTARESDEPSRVRVTTRALDDAVELSVHDNGGGVPDEIAERVFLPFFTTKPPHRGTGLGLTISRHIVTEQHRGSIELRSEVGESTELIVRLPRERPAAASRSDNAPPDPLFPEPRSSDLTE